MTEIVINYGNLSGLVGLATQLGYYDPNTHAITAVGMIDTRGSYFFNNVGAVSGAPGLWARLRHNGDPAVLQAKIPSAATLASFGVTVYRNDPAIGWTADGTTPAPAYVANIGVIA